jgi:hypothetical protein
MTRPALPLLLVLACAACSKPPQPPAAQPPTPQARVSTPWDAMEAQKKKAEGVQTTVDDQAKAQAAAIRSQEQ